MYTTRNLSR